MAEMTRADVERRVRERAAQLQTRWTRRGFALLWLALALSAAALVLASWRLAGLAGLVVLVGTGHWVAAHMAVSEKTIQAGVANFYAQRQAMRDAP